jgi:hypothetical protein
VPISIPESLVVALPPILSPSSRTFVELTLVNWDEYSDESESSMDRYRDPKHNRRATTCTREESYTKNQSA